MVIWQKKWSMQVKLSLNLLVLKIFKQYIFLLGAAPGFHIPFLLKLFP
jgi:hypothetical protein